MTPLVFDLDGTLISTDLLVEYLLVYVKTNPFRIFLLPFLLLGGRARLKRSLSQTVEFDAALLPLREDLVAYGEQEAAKGRTVIIATAADELAARKVMARLPFVSELIASDGSVNLKSHAKAKALQARFPEGFAYAGDSSSDLSVWAAASETVYAGPSAGLERRVGKLRAPAAVFRRANASLRDWVKALRLHQWAKNALLFVPMALGGALASPRAWIACILGFIAIGILASATYVLNDLIDLHDDRAHWSKQNRAFAKGRIPIAVGLVIIPFGLAAGLLLGFIAAGVPGLLTLAAYLTVTLAYSFKLKRVPVLDVMILAALFTIRLAMGVVFSGVTWSSWLLVFSMFIFSSLSFAKRATEIARLKARGGEKLAGRGYMASDEPFVFAIGVSLASAAVFVMVMYLIEEAFKTKLYSAPQYMWAFPCILGLWLGRIWLLCGRGELNDDPVAFAVRDRVSIGLGAMLGTFLIASLVL